jgi:hypothetical protein
MACACGGRNRARAAGSAKTTTTLSPSTYRVYVGSRKVYESANGPAANEVAARFTDARVLAPGVEA